MEQVGDGKRVKLFNHFSKAAQQLPLPYLLRWMDRYRGGKKNYAFCVK